MPSAFFAPTSLESPVDNASPPRGRVRLAFLDGLRGLSALYVMLFHLGIPDGVPLGLKIAWEWTHFGRNAVGVFIVLSGYSLMLPVVRSADGGQLPGGVWKYIKRRARRILPPYYAAIAVIVALLLLAKLLGPRIGNLSQNAHAASLTPDNILAHLLLLQNYTEVWNSGIETSMWSISLEWQIYFLFPWLFLPLWRRFGLAAPIAAALVIGIAPLILLPRPHNFAWASPWFAALFALGMAGAVLSFSLDARMQRRYQTLPWGRLASAAFGLFFLLFLFQEHYPLNSAVALALGVGLDLLIGLAALCLILFCCRSAHAATRDAEACPPLILRLLESRWARGLGAFSYSLYLIHMPLVQKLAQWASNNFPPVAAFAVSLVGLPLVVGFAYLFYLAFERRFTPEYRIHKEPKASHSQ